MKKLILSFLTITILLTSCTPAEETNPNPLENVIQNSQLIEEPTNGNF